MLGVGTPEGAPIPTGNTNEFRKDKDGNIVVTRLNEAMSQSIAQAGNGAYIRVDNTNNAQKLLQKEIDKLAKADVTTEVYTEYNEQFIFVAWILLIVLVIDILILPMKSRLTKSIKLFDDKN